MTQTEDAEVAALIAKALSGVLTIDEASNFLSSLRTGVDRNVSEAAHAIVHFLTDEDIRHRDREYDSLLREELEQYAKDFCEKSRSQMG